MTEEEGVISLFFFFNLSNCHMLGAKWPSCVEWLGDGSDNIVLFLEKDGEWKWTVKALIWMTCECYTYVSFYLLYNCFCYAAICR